MRATPWQLGLVSLAVLLIGLNAGADDAIPFPAALDAAAVTVDRLDSVLDYALLIGNGDMNALVYTDRGQLKLNLTKNDVWDARLDADRDPPLPTLELVKKWAFDRGATSVQNGSVILDEGVTMGRAGQLPCASLSVPSDLCPSDTRCGAGGTQLDPHSRRGYPERLGISRRRRRDEHRRQSRSFQRFLLRPSRDQHGDLPGTPGEGLRN